MCKGCNRNFKQLKKHLRYNSNCSSFNSAEINQNKITGKEKNCVYKEKSRKNLRGENEKEFKERERASKEQSRNKLRGENEEELKKKEQNSKKQFRNKLKKKDINTYREQVRMYTKKSRLNLRNANEEEFKERERGSKELSRNKLRGENEKEFKERERGSKQQSRKRKREACPQIYKLHEAQSKLKYRKISLLNFSLYDRFIAFRKSIQYGRIHKCESCHRKLYLTSLTSVNNSWISTVTDLANLSWCTNYSDHKELIGKYLCNTCILKIKVGKIPSNCHKNGLELFDLKNYPEFDVTELENSLIARNIIFQKFVILPKSRMKGLRGKIVNVPTNAEDVTNTINRLPRNIQEANIISIPEARSNINDESNIIPVSFKRKLIYKHSYLEAYINVSRIFKAIKSMKQLRNPFYTDVQAIENKQIYSR